MPQSPRQRPSPVFSNLASELHAAESEIASMRAEVEAARLLFRENVVLRQRQSWLESRVHELELTIGEAS